MRKYLAILILMATAFQACKREELIGQYGVDKIPPGPINTPIIKNVAGGAEITYNIPNDIDLLYVKAVYQRNGQTIEQKSSAYANKIIIEGFGKAQEQKVTLTAYDRSNNASTPIEVKIQPLDAAIYTTLASLKAQNDFGGIRLDWENPFGADIVITVLTATSKYGVEEYTEVQNFYTSTKLGKGNVRGFIEDEVEFGICLRDRWGNVTDTIFNKYNPIYEVELNKSLFRRWNPSGIPYTGWTTAQWRIENLWNNLLGPGGNSGFANYNLEFTFDLGQTAKISRFKINQRSERNLIYNLGHPKKFQVWGSATSNVNADFLTWRLLGEFESIKPSGRPLGDVTDEDVQYAYLDGESWDVSVDAAPVRYLRFICQETWAQASVIQIMEMTLWGDNKY